MKKYRMPRSRTSQIDIPVGAVTIKREDWLNPIAMSQLQKAVKRKADKVTLDEREYEISYGHFFTSSVTKTTYECVRLRRVDGGFVPFGYVRLDKIKSFDFEKDVR